MGKGGISRHFYWSPSQRASAREFLNPTRNSSFQDNKYHIQHALQWKYHRAIPSPETSRLLKCFYPKQLKAEMGKGRLRDYPKQPWAEMGNEKMYIT